MLPFLLGCCCKEQRGDGDFCRLLARDNKPIVSREASPNYTLVRIQECSYPSSTRVEPKRRHRIATPDWEMLMRDDRDLLDTITIITTSGILDE